MGFILNKNGDFIADSWVDLTSSDDRNIESVSSSGDSGVILTLPIYQEAIKKFGKNRVGLLFSTKEVSVSERYFLNGFPIGKQIYDVPLIAISGVRFSDGRVFSMARKFRDMGYHKVLRLASSIIPDQVANAFSCGFDEIYLSNDVLEVCPKDQWLKALSISGSSANYQLDYFKDSIFSSRYAGVFDNKSIDKG